VLLVRADVRNKKTFWTAPQLDSGTLRSLATKSSTRTVTFRIPTKNLLPENVPQLLDAVGQALSTRSLLSTPVPDFLTSVENRVDKGQVGQELQNKSDAIRLSQAEELFESGSFNEVRIKIRRIISDPEASVENRFWALLTAERLEVTDGLQNGMVEENVARILLTIRAQMKQVTRKGPHHLKFFSLIALKAAELYALTSRDLAMYLNLLELEDQQGRGCLLESASGVPPGTSDCRGGSQVWAMYAFSWVRGKFTFPIGSPPCVNAHCRGHCTFRLPSQG